jgi:hypothetical protein
VLKDPWGLIGVVEVVEGQAPSPPPPASKATLRQFLPSGYAAIRV